jgi:hypothetical protein
VDRERVVSFCGDCCCHPRLFSWNRQFPAFGLFSHFLNGGTSLHVRLGFHGPSHSALFTSARTTGSAANTSLHVCLGFHRFFPSESTSAH